MERKYKSFEELRESVFEKYRSFGSVHWEYLNERGKVVRRAYDVLDDTFRFVDTKKDVVDMIAQEIHGLENPRGFVYVYTAEENLQVADKLRRYITWNFERELWKNIPEFDVRKEN